MAYKENEDPQKEDTKKDLKTETNMTKHSKEDKKDVTITSETEVKAENVDRKPNIAATDSEDSKDRKRKVDEDPPPPERKSRRRTETKEEEWDWKESSTESGVIQLVSAVLWLFWSIVSL